MCNQKLVTTAVSYAVQISPSWSFACKKQQWNLWNPCFWFVPLKFSSNSYRVCVENCLYLLFFSLWVAHGSMYPVAIWCPASWPLVVQPFANIVQQKLKHYVQTFQPNSFLSAVPIGTYSLPTFDTIFSELSPWGSLEGYKQNLLTFSSRLLITCSGWNLVLC